MTISRLRAALAGLLAAAAGLSCAELVAGALQLATTPIVAVGNTFIDLIPTGVREFGIQLLGTADKPTLVTGIVVVLGAIAALAGIVAARSREAGYAIFAALALVALIASVTRPASGPVDVLPSLVAGVVGVAVLRWLLRAYERDVAGAGTSPVSRRDLLRSSGLVLVGSVVAGGVGRGLSGVAGRRRVVEEARTKLPLPKIPNPDPPANASFDVQGISPWQTPNDIFYRIDTALSVPVVDPTGWRLRVHGMVDKPLNLSFKQLLQRKVVQRYVTLTCVSNEVGGELAGNALWTGVPIADILAEAKPHADADAVKSTSKDGWTCGTPLEVLTDGRPALLAFAMNGSTLPIEHGFPVRMVVPGLYGYVSATKWVVDIEVTRFDRFHAYWTDRGWSERGPIKTESRIDVPQSGATVKAGKVAVAGVAWAQHRGVSKVEVRVDDESWQSARLAGEPTKDSWRQWVWTWDATPGKHKIQVRATDATGATQTGQLAPPPPNGATGWHTIEVKVS